MHLSAQKATLRSWAFAFAGVLLLSAGFLISFGAPGASAAPVTPTSTTLTATQSTNASGAPQNTTMVTFCLPDGTVAGSTFSLTLPASLTGALQPFSLLDGNGNDVADASIAPGPPEVVTFTTTAYDTGVQNVCGQAQFTNAFATDTYGTTVDLTYVGPDGSDIPKGPYSVPAAVGITRSIPNKFGGFTSGDDCETAPKDCIVWTLDSPSGPLSNVVFSDTATSPQTFDCNSVSLQLGNDSGTNGTFVYESALTPTTDTCTSAGINLTYAPLITTGQIVQLVFDASIPAGVGGTSTTFPNDQASVDWSVNGVAQPTQAVQNSVTTPSDGGSGTDNTSTTSTSTSTTSTTVAPTTTTVKPTTTSSSTTSTTASTTTTVPKTTTTVRAVPVVPSATTTTAAPVAPVLTNTATLAVTGTDVWRTVTGGAGLVVGGIGVVGLARRHRKAGKHSS